MTSACSRHDTVRTSDYPGFVVPEGEGSGGADRVHEF